MAKNLNTTIAASLNTAAAAAAPKKARKPRAAKSESVTVEHAMTVEHASIPVAGNEDLDALLADLGLHAEEVVEAAPAADEVMVLDAALPVAEEGETAADLEAAVSGAETAELMSAAATEDGIDGSAPTGAASELIAETEGAAPAKKASTPRVRYTDKVERLKARVGDKLAEYSVLTTADVMSADTDEALDAVMERTMDIVKAMNKKVGNRGVGFIEWLAGKKASLNNVIERALKLLSEDGYLQTGEEGNLMKNLLARPYSLASARAMGGNTIVMLKDLKVILPLEGHKGRFVPNHDSLLLMKACSLMTAPAAVAVAVAADAGEAEGDTDEA